MVGRKFGTENFGTENIGPNGFKYLVCHKFGQEKRAKITKCAVKLLKFPRENMIKPHFWGEQHSFSPVLSLGDSIVVNGTVFCEILIFFIYQKLLEMELVQKFGPLKIWSTEILVQIKNVDQNYGRPKFWMLR